MQEDRQAEIVLKLHITVRQTCRQVDIQIDRTTDRQPVGQIDGQKTGSWTEKHGQADIFTDNQSVIR